MLFARTQRSDLALSLNGFALASRNGHGPSLRHHLGLETEGPTGCSLAHVNALTAAQLSQVQTVVLVPVETAIGLSSSPAELGYGPITAEHARDWMVASELRHASVARRPSGPGGSIVRVPDLVAAKLTSQQLSGPPARSVGEVVGRLLAVQAQDPKGARLAVRARSTGLVAAEVDKAFRRREVVVGWLNRGTLHLVRAEDYGWLHALTTPQLATSNATRLRQEGVSPEQAERGVQVVSDELASGPKHRDLLREALRDKGIPVAGQAFVHVLFRASLLGVCLRSHDHELASVEDWLGPQAPVDRDEALRRLGARYLAGHAPATPADLAKWAGLTLRDARTALDGQDTATEAEPLPGPRLLGPFEPVLLGWADRSDVCPQTDGVVTSNGIFHPVILVKGRAVGTWSVATGELRPFRPLTSSSTKALMAELEDVRRFLG